MMRSMSDEQPRDEDLDRKRLHRLVGFLLPRLFRRELP
jgi:hypothetical protein